MKVPIASQAIAEQKVVDAGWLTVDAVVRAHDRLGFPFRDRLTKGGKIGFSHVMQEDAYLKGMPRLSPQQLWSAASRIS